MKLQEMISIALFSVSGAVTACVVTGTDDADTAGTAGTGGTDSGTAGAANGGDAAGLASSGASAGTTTRGGGGPGNTPGGSSTRGGAAAGGVSEGGVPTDATPSGGAAPGGSSSGGGSSGGSSSGGGSSGGTAGEYVDGDGRCRARTVPYTVCPDNDTNPPNSPCGSLCESECGGVKVQIRFCTPTQGCAYDLESGELIGMMFGDDVKDHCGGRSYEVISGDWPYVPEGCTLTSPNHDSSCPMGAISL